MGSRGWSGLEHRLIWAQDPRPEWLSFTAEVFHWLAEAHNVTDISLSRLVWDILCWVTWVRKNDSLQMDPMADIAIKLLLFFLFFLQAMLCIDMLLCCVLRGLQRRLQRRFGLQQLMGQGVKSHHHCKTVR